MKNILLITLYLFSIKGFAMGWTEELTCQLTRTSENGEVVTTTESARFSVSGPHNGESGSVKISSELIPSYTVSYQLVASGRYDLHSLTTTLNSDGSVVAKTSAFNGGEAILFRNTFVTQKGDSVIDIECSNSTVR